MIGQLMGKEEVNAAMVLALSGALVALVAKGEGPLSFGRLVSGVLSNPAPKAAVDTRTTASVLNAAR